MELARKRSALTLLLFLFLFSLPKLSAQTTTGSIYGTVADTTGARVPGAAVVATNIQTGAKSRAVSNDSGEYIFLTLSPGDYEVSSSVTGFKSQTQTGISLSSNQNIHANLTLEPGQVSENVEVVAGVTLVDTRESQIGETIDQRRLEELPLNGRNAYDLVTIVPGVTNYTPDSPVGSRTGSSFSVNGLSSDMVTTYLDGAYDVAFFQNGSNRLPNPDSLQEFRVITTNFDAEFGRSPGAVVNVITRSGTSQVHGMAYEYLRNNMFNAKNYFLASVSPLKQNQFGGNVGGPIAKGDRAFAFLSYERFIMHTPASIASSDITTATALERKGDFSQSKVKPTLPAGSNCGTAAAPMICMSSLDTVAQNLLAFIPVRDAVTGLTPQQNANANQQAHQGLGRVDFNGFAKHQLEAMFFNSRGVNIAPTAGGNQIFSYAGMTNYENQVNAVLADTWTVSPQSVNSIHGFYTQNRYIIGNIYTNHYITDLGNKSGLGGVAAAPARVSVTGYWAMGTNQAGPSDISQLSFGLVDTMNLNRKAHSIKIGGSYVRLKYAETGGLQAGGTATFTGGITGNALADFLLGRANTFTQTNSTVHRTHSYDPAAFAQDNWQVSKKLNVNMGVRWEVFPPFTGDQSNGTFQTGVQSTVFPSAPIGLLYQGDKGIPNGIYRTYFDKFAPRVGFAYDVFGQGRTSVRGGFGIFYFMQNEILTGILTQQPYGLTKTVNNTPNLVNPYAPDPSPFPFVFNSGAPKFVSGATITNVPRNGGTVPYVEEYNLTLEQEIGTNWATRISYVGNALRKNYVVHDTNAPIYAPGASVTTAGLNARRPYEPTPATFTFATINTYDPIENGSYNSLQTAIRGKIGSRFSLFASYVWSKDINYNSPFVDATDVRKNRGLAENDVRNRFVASYIFRLPETKRFGPVGKEIINGWQLNGITTLQSGAPFTVISGQDTNLDGVTNDRVDIVADPYFHGSRSRKDRIQTFLNPSAFAVPVGPYGNEQRDALIGPRYVDTDFSLFKSFPVHDRFSLQFRAEAFNAFGNVNLSLPVANLQTLIARQTASPTQNQITAANTPRILQFALKALF